MGKKFITAGIIAIILFFSTAFCYATQDGNNSNNVNLGDQITESINKVENTGENLKNNIKDNNMVNGVLNGMNSVGDRMKTDYNVARTTVDTNLNNGTRMTGTTWVWIILAVVGVIILATVWFYAMQNSGRD